MSIAQVLGNNTTPTSYLVDDSNTDLIQYSGRWNEQGSSQEFEGSTHMTVTAGSFATFSFKGTYVAVYGTFGPQIKGHPTVSTYQVDGTSPYSHMAPGTNETIYGQEFFQSSLDDGQHTLTIKYMDGSPLYLDYIRYTPSASPPSSRVNAGVIAGGVVGGVVLIGIFIMGLVWLRRRRRRHNPADSENLDDPDRLLTPYPLMSASITTSTPQVDVQPARPPPNRKDRREQSDLNNRGQASVSGVQQSTSPQNQNMIDGPPAYT